MSLITLRFHLYAASFMGTARHLREVHHLPEDLIDAEDHVGLHVDHAFLHGYVFTGDDRLVEAREVAKTA